MVQLVSDKIKVDDLFGQMEDHSTGAVTIFLGRVRDFAESRHVIKMKYQAYADMALKKMQAIETEVQSRWPVKKMTIIHRTGELGLGEISVAIAVACPHRGDAFEACRFAIDTLKETVPIWKKEYFVGGESWVEGIVPKA